MHLGFTLLVFKSSLQVTQTNCVKMFQVLNTDEDLDSSTSKHLKVYIYRFYAISLLILCTGKINP